LVGYCAQFTSSKFQVLQTRPIRCVWRSGRFSITACCVSFFFFFLCVQIDMKLIKNSKSAFDFECTHNTLLIRPLQLALLTTFSLISSLSTIFSKCEKDLLELLLRIVFFNWFFFFYSYKFLLISIMSLEL